MGDEKGRKESGAANSTERLILLGLLLAAVVAVSALLMLGTRMNERIPGPKWREEVRLMNGDLIIADMRNVYGESGDPSVSQGPLTFAEIKFEYRGKKYEWGMRGVWPTSLQVDSDGRPYIITTIPYCWAWSERGRPDSYYVVFRHEGSGWVEIPVQDIDQNAVFNLAGESQAQHGKELRKYIGEHEDKYKDFNLLKYQRQIVLEKMPACY